MSHVSNYQPSSHHNKFFFYWARWVVKHPLAVAAISAMITLTSLFLVIPSQKLPVELATARASLLNGPGLIVDTSVDAFSDPSNDSVEVLERYRDLFGRDDYFMVLIEGDVFSMPYLERLQKLHRELEGLNVEIETLGERRVDRVNAIKSLPSNATGSSKSATKTNGGDLGDSFGFDEGLEEEDQGWGEEDQSTVIEEVTSLINARRTRGDETGLVIDKWLDPIPAENELAEYKSLILNDDTLVGQMVGAKGRHSLILLRANFMSEDDTIIVNKEITKIAKRYHDPESFDVKISGMPELNGTLKNSLLGTLKLLLILSVILMIAMLTYQFRHIIGVIPPLIVVGMAALNTFAAMCLLGMPVTMLSNILPAFIICVGIGDSVHLLSVYRDHFKEHKNPKLAAIETVAMTGLPVLFTSLTTMVGLLSFRLASIPAIQEMGTAGAIGVGAACLHSILFLPMILSFNPGSLLGLKEEKITEASTADHKSSDWLDRFIKFISDSSAGVSNEGAPREESPSERNRRKLTLTLGLVITLIAIFGASKLRVWHSPLAWLPEGQPAKVAFDITDREIGGTANLQLLIKGGERGMKDLELLKGIEALKEHILSYIHPDEGDIIGNSINVNDIVKETRRALHQGNEADYRLPDTNEELSQLLFLFENSGPDQLRKLATNDLSVSQMTVRLKWLEATAYRGLTDHVKEGIERFIPSYAKVSPTGTVYTLVSTVGALLMDLVKSFGSALLIITLIMIFMLKGLKLGLLSMIPNLIPIVWLMGFMGFAGITIDMNNILIASIAIGLAVDDTIHLLHHFRVHYEEDGDAFTAISASLNHAGRAMVTTSSILTLGFFAYIFSDMKNIQIFGLLIGLSAAMAMLIDLIFGPALLRTCYPRQKK